MTSQAPHAIRTVARASSPGLPEQNIRVKTHDIGGGFGGKVPVYPGYVLAVAASFLTGKPVKWIEDRSENLQADSFARDYHIHAELGATKDGKITGAQGQDDRRPRLHRRRGRPVEVPGRPVQRHHRLVRLPGRVRRGRRRLHEQAARRRRLPLLVPGDRGRPRDRADGRHPRPRHRQGPGPAPDGELHPARPVPVQDADRLGVRLGQLPGRAPEGDGHDRLRRPAQGAGREARRAASSWASASAASPRSSAPGRRTTSTSSGSRCSTACEIRVHPTGKVARPDRRPDPGPGPRDDVRPDHRRGARLPGRRHQDRVRRHRHRAVRARHVRARARRRSPARPPRWPSRKIQDKARKLAAHLLEASEDDLEWTNPASSASRARPTGSRRSRRSRSRPTPTIPQGMEAGLEAVDYYDPPNLTFPFGSYICVVDIDKGTGAGPRPPLRRRRRLRQHHQPDDRRRADPRRPDDGPRPGAVRGDHVRRARQQPRRHVHGLPPPDRGRDARPGRPARPITPSPHHPIGAKGVGESATVGAPPAIANAVVDALWHLGVRNIDIPITPQKVWAILHEKGICLDVMTPRSDPVRAGRRARGGRPAVRGRHGRRGPAADVGPARRVAGSSTRTARSRAGSAAAAPSRSSSARRSARSPTASRGCSACRRTRPAEGRRGDGVIELVMTCHSGGTLEIYVEPHLPAPVAVGRRHDARSPARSSTLGAAAGWRVTVFDPIADADGVPGAERVRRPAPTSSRSSPRRRPYVVVATQGIWDEEALAAALAPRRVVRRASSPRRPAPPSSATWLREETDRRRGAARRAARAGRARPRRRDGRGGRPLDPRRARPGPARPRRLRRLARPGDARRRGQPPTPIAARARSSTTSSCSTRSAG